MIQPPKQEPPPRRRTNFGAILYLAMAALACGIGVTIAALNHVRPPPPSEDAQVFRALWINLRRHHKVFLSAVVLLIGGAIAWVVIGAFWTYPYESVIFTLVMLGCAVAWHKLSQEKRRARRY